MCISIPGITYPSASAQQSLLEMVYNEANVNPLEVSYFEAHGTGTQAGDTHELNTIDKVFCTQRQTPLLVGSTKSNMGHAEVSAGG